MKKSIFVVIIVGMFAWAVYVFAVPADKNTKTSTDKTTTDYESETETASSNEQGESAGKVAETGVIGIDVGDTAPDFQLETLSGKKVKLSDYRGGPVMLNFWASWCPPCRAEMPDMEKLHQNKDVTILAVNLTESESGKGNVKEFVNKYNLTFPILLDEEVRVAAMYQIRPIPTTFFIDSEGVIQYTAFGAMNYELMVQELEKIN
ncbi:TlpA family protein disulfide reductase [Virgibacillus siamensis]|uniref:TlpA family protein disulfide reductase n=1 Tax=Virgibacillus siamensis TaxID=480071 RepID=UPI000986CDA2|nr:redoxin domain-containing protein [Virgibacillus siamensis]